MDSIPRGHVPDAGYFRSQLPIPTLTTPAPISVPSTQPQPPSSRSESKHAPASLHGTTHPAPHTIRLHHPEVKIPPDGFIPTFDPVDKSISIPPPHELGRFVVPVEVDEEEAKYGPEVFTSSKSKGKTPMRGDGTKEYDMQAPSPKMDSKNGYPASAARPPTSHRDTKEVLPRYIPPQPKAVGETDHFDYDPTHDHAIELGNMTGWTNVTDLLESSTPRTRRQIAESMKDEAESIWSFGPPSTRISQYELVATPRSPRSVIGSRAAAGGDSTDARGLTSPDDDNDDAGSESFGFDFLAYNKRRRERQAQTATQTTNSPTPVPSKGAGAITQPQELAADWRSRNGYGQTSGMIASGSQSSHLRSPLSQSPRTPLGNTGIPHTQAITLKRLVFQTRQCPFGMGVDSRYVRISPTVLLWPPCPRFQSLVKAYGYFPVSAGILRTAFPARVQVSLSIWTFVNSIFDGPNLDLPNTLFLISRAIGTLFSPKCYSFYIFHD